MTDLTHKKILIVDDEETLRKALVEKLTNEGFTTLEAYNGQIGLQSALENHPDIILLDIVMPVMGGIEMLKALREDTWGKNVHVIVLTNSNDNEDLVKVLETETFEYFVKSDIKIEDIVAKIKSTLG